MKNLELNAFIGYQKGSALELRINILVRLPKHIKYILSVPNCYGADKDGLKFCTSLKTLEKQKKVFKNIPYAVFNENGIVIEKNRITCSAQETEFEPCKARNRMFYKQTEAGRKFLSELDFFETMGIGLNLLNINWDKMTISTKSI